jgi:S-DNA-T family DNA segregation ATPase FtsK/SpoIIIE
VPEKARVRKVTERPAIVKRPSLTERAGTWLKPRLQAIAQTLRDPAFWRGLAQKLPPWTDEVGAILLVVLGVVMLTALLNSTSEAMLAINLSHGLRQIFGYGAYGIALMMMASGVIVLLPKFGIVLRLGWVRITAIEVSFAAFTALLHLFANDPQPRVLAREGGGGGFLGWGLSETFSIFGHTIAILFFILVLIGGLVTVTGLRLRHLVGISAWMRGRLQRSINHLDAMSFEQPYVPQDESEPDTYYPDDDPPLSSAGGSSSHNILPPASTPTSRRTSIVPRDDSGTPSDSAAGIKPPSPRRTTRVTPPSENSETKPREKTNGHAQLPARPSGLPEQVSESGNGQQPAASKARLMTKAEKKELVEQTRRTLGGENGRSLVAPGGPGERASVVPRELLLPDARVVPDAPRARNRRKIDEAGDRYFTVEDFREVKKIGKRDASLPPLELLSDVELNKPTEEEINTNARIIKNTLLEFDVETEVIDVKVGPTVTQYAISPYTEQVNDNGETVLNRVRVSEITNLNGDLALALSAKRLRIQAPVPGHSYVGVEVPNHLPSTVALRPVLESENFYKYRERPLALPLGRDVSGDALITDLGTMPHLLIAGTTGSGKSIMLAAMTTAFVMNNPPDRLKLILLDPKMVELSRFNGLPHLLGQVETELDRIIGVLRWTTREMDRRYKLLEKEAARNIETFNKALGKRRKDEHLPYIALIIDEIGDLMMQRPDETERALTRLAQMARAVGIHLMVATQRPSVDVITGLIKANFPARISFAVASSVDSRVILDTTGAESLMGRGDMLFLAPDASGPRRIQGCYVSDDEVNSVVEYWKNWHAAQIEAGNLEYEAVPPWERGMTRREVLSETDPMLEEAIALVIAEGEASASLIQRRLGLGYPRAARLIDLMHELGVIGAPRPGGRSREVLYKPGTDPFKKLVDKRIKDKQPTQNPPTAP